MRGVDGVVDAVDFEAKGSTTETILTTLKIDGSSGKARRHGKRSGVYSGFIHGFLFGDAFDKGLTFKMGQTHVQRFLPELLEHIELGHISPEAIITHRMSLEQADEGYNIFDKKQEDCRKVILTPGRDGVELPAETG